MFIAFSQTLIMLKIDFKAFLRKTYDRRILFNIRLILIIIMEMIDNPLPFYNNNIEKTSTTERLSVQLEMNENPLTGNNKRNIRIQSFTEKEITEESSGLTLGLILKEYCEFQVLIILTLVTNII